MVNWATPGLVVFHLENLGMFLLGQYLWTKVSTDCMPTCSAGSDARWGIGRFGGVG